MIVCTGTAYEAALTAASIRAEAVPSSTRNRKWRDAPTRAQHRWQRRREEGVQSEFALMVSAKCPCGALGSELR